MFRPVEYILGRSLVVKQPYADQILTGEKPVEYRSWATPYRGPLVILASHKPDPDACGDLGITLAQAKRRSGCVVCLVTLDDVQGSEGNWEWILSNPVRLPPFECLGKLKIFPTDPDLIQAIRTDTEGHGALIRYGADPSLLTVN